MRKLFLIAAAILALPSRAYASEPLFDSAPLDDEELEQARGGFTLPNGIEISFGATIATTVGNDVALLTTMRLTDDHMAYTVQPGQVDGKPVTVELQGGTAVVEGGTLTINPNASGAGIALTVETADLLIRHAVGSGLSSIIANTADGRVIDNQMVVDLKLDNVAPLAIGSVGLQIESMGVDAASFRAP